MLGKVDKPFFAPLCLLEITSLNTEQAIAIRDLEPKRAKLAVLTRWKEWHIVRIVGVCDLMHACG